MSYTDPEKASFVVRFIEEEYDYPAFVTRVRRDARNGRAKVPKLETVQKWVDTFLETGTAHGQRGMIKSRPIRTEDAIEDVREAFSNNPHLSTRRNPFVRTEESDDEDEEHNTVRMSDRTLRRILKEDLGLRPYHMQMAHALEETDYAARIAFCQDESGRLEADPDRLNNMVFTDEAHFHLCGGVNQQDWIMWADENPHWFDVRQLHPQKVTVWMGIGIEGVVGPFFWEPRGTEKETNSRWMISLLENQVIPSLQYWPNFDQLAHLSTRWRSSAFFKQRSDFAGSCVSKSLDWPRNTRPSSTHLTFYY